MLSTATLVRLGYITGNRMTSMRARNSKLHARSLRILMTEAGIDEPAAAVALDAAAGDLPTALVMWKTGRSRPDAAAALATSRGVIESAVAYLLGGRG
jgi:N-acetylmuramic acid 6-phosphate etherase